MKTFQERLRLVESILNGFCKAYKLPTVRETKGELQNLTKEQIAVLFLMIPQYIDTPTVSRAYMSGRLVPGIYARQNSEPHWWIKELCLYLRQHGV